MGLYEDYCQRMQSAEAAQDREALSDAYNDAIADFNSGEDISRREMVDLRELYVDICYRNNWRL